MMKNRFIACLAVAGAASLAAPATALATAALSDDVMLTEIRADLSRYGATNLYHLYVSPSGNDANPGTVALPLRTIQRASELAKPSTTIHVAPGIYTGNIDSRASGTATERIVFISDRPGEAMVIGTGTETMWKNNGSYVDIVGFDISGPGRLGIYNAGSYTSIVGNRVHDLAVSGGCTGSGGAGILNGNYSAMGNDIIGNTVRNIGKRGGCNGVQGIYHSNLGGVIANNVVSGASAWGIHLWHAANKVTITNNTVVANGSSTMGGGIVVGSGDSPGGIVLDDTKVHNNLVFDNPRSGIEQYCYTGQACIGSRNTTMNNLVFGSARAITLKVGTDVGTVAADPKLMNYAGGDYRLKKKSPAIDAGTADGAPAYDVNHVSRPAGAGFDIGAFERPQAACAPAATSH